MFNSEENHDLVGRPKKDLARIHPLKDHVIKHNEFYYDIVKGVSMDVDKRFLEVLKTEKVIN